MKVPRSCISPEGQFIVGIHRPSFQVKNLRPNRYLESLGQLEDKTVIDNQVNFPLNDLEEPSADIIYEIPNAFDFRGTTFINSAWADKKAEDPESIAIPAPDDCSLLDSAAVLLDKTDHQPIDLIDMLPHPLQVALAQASTNPEEIVLLACKSCRILYDKDGTTPAGIGYIKREDGSIIPDIRDHELFEILVNNPHLPDEYKNVMVLKPGVQGHNEITAEYLEPRTGTHVFEYLRRNSYIPWGHFASNMANDAIRYSVQELSESDMRGIRHLYYQRAFVRVAQLLDIRIPEQKDNLSPKAMEALRQAIIDQVQNSVAPSLKFDSTLWGWNYGFGYAQSGQRLHASHQMIHQQNAMIPKSIPTTSGGKTKTFACGDQVADFIQAYQKKTGASFFKAYVSAIQNNTRTDGKKEGPSSLVVHEDDSTLLFVPKAQVCEFELQLMTKSDAGNIFETDRQTRESLDRNILKAVQILDALGATMITSIEYSSRLNKDSTGQHLLYSFIPKLPYAPGTFSEAQSRWICGLYPEDFARACRTAANTISKGEDNDYS